MAELYHRVRVFVFRYDGKLEPSYLLLRGAQMESFWTPLHGTIGFGEQLEAAIRREVMDETGLGRPVQLIDLQMPARWLVGDEEVIEWNFGFRAAPSPTPRIDGERWAEHRWAPFPEAYPSLEFQNDRAAIMRLHALVHAA